MIPPSYLFKSVYQHAWEDQPTLTTPTRPKFYQGLLTPLMCTIRSVLHRPTQSPGKRFRNPACD